MIDVCDVFDTVFWVSSQISQELQILHPNLPGVWQPTTGPPQYINLTGSMLTQIYSVFVYPVIAQIDDGVLGPIASTALDVYSSASSDAWSCCELNDLNWYRTHQKSLRVDKYSAFEDRINNDDEIDLHHVGRERVVLPSSFCGGPRGMKMKMQDCLALVRRFGKPDFFITFTCNPAWPEIEECIELGWARNLTSTSLSGCSSSNWSSFLRIY